MKKNLSLIIGVITVSLLIGTVHLFATPGDGDDPIITLSYINDVLIPKFTQLMSEKSPDTFKIVDLAAGDKLICYAGTELILRMGNAKIIASEKGGIANVTAGVDLTNGAAVPSNAHLIVPLGDGRGIHATEKVIVMVKGSYNIQK